jgi:hypothetical protein
MLSHAPANEHVAPLAPRETRIMGRPPIEYPALRTNNMEVFPALPGFLLLLASFPASRR